MRFEELNWFDVETYLEKEDRIMLVFGSCEQHGYLSLMTDAKIPASIADAASQKTGVLVAPVVNFGASAYFLAYPGTISLRVTTLMDLAEDIIRSLYGHGFRRMIILNGHGGNEPIRGRLYELTNSLHNIKISWFSWWQSHSVESICRKYGLKSYHAGWIEAFSFTQVAELPVDEKIPLAVPGLTSADEARHIFGDGVFGGKYAVDESIMHEIFREMVADVVEMLKFNE